MSGTLLGSCCEVQEEEEAKFRNKIKAATQANEKRMLKKHHIAIEFNRQLRRGGITCDCDECAEAEQQQDHDTKHEAKTSQSESEPDEEDFADAALLRKIRAKRMAQLREEQDARKREGLGKYQRVDAVTLFSFMSNSGKIPTICHLWIADDLAASIVDQRLDEVSSSYGEFRFLRLDATNGLPEPLPFVGPLPILLLIEDGIVSSKLEGLHKFREQARVSLVLDSWLSGENERIRRERVLDQGSGDEEEESYCGRAGCRSYPHEHVSWGKR